MPNIIRPISDEVSPRDDLSRLKDRQRTLEALGSVVDVLQMGPAITPPGTPENFEEYEEHVRVLPAKPHKNTDQSISA